MAEARNGGKTRRVPLSADTLAAKAFAVTSYADAYAIDLPPGREYDVDALARLIATSAPRWAEQLMWLRNRIVSVFGLRTGNAKISQPVSSVPILAGDKIGSFNVVERADDEIMFGGDDKHLDFRGSVLLRRDAAGGSAAVLSTVVHYNNWFGRVYFFFVRPFHALIVASLLRNLRRRVDGGSASTSVE